MPDTHFEHRLPHGSAFIIITAIMIPLYAAIYLVIR